MGSSVLSILKKIEKVGSLSGLHQAKIKELQVEFDDLKEEEEPPMF